jgi:menaquinone-dependent protoporphyrinogen oxidase
MKKVLVAYATMAGSTAEIAAAVAEELTKCGHHAQVLPMAQVRSLDGYDAVVLGAPMILGWHRSARKFLRSHRKQLQHVPFAVFASAMSLTKSGETSINGVPLWIDENLPKPPQNPGKLSFRERYASLANYTKPMVKNVHPASIGIFGGRMEYGRLKWWAVLFAMVIVQSPAGDKRNWSSIRLWAASLPPALKL